MEWVVKYYNGTLQLIEVSSSDMNWYELPIDGVIEVKISKGSYTHILRGMDNYWLNGFSYGMFNNVGDLALLEEENRRQNNYQYVVYEGLSWVEYNWEKEHRILTQKSNYNNYHIIRGVMVPDNHAHIFGLI